MELTQQILDGYVGGQLEVQNRNEGYLYRGEISEIKLEGHTDETRNVWVNFAWCAKMGETHGWENHSRDPYSAGLLLFQARDAGFGRLMLTSQVTGEVVVFYPPGGSTLDPDKIKDLVRA